MGVPGLWKELAPAAKIRSLTELAVVEGFEANPNGSRGFRIGIDASIWFFHAAYGKEGENPELRTMFFRCATLTHAPFLPLFVFDGPRRPNVKRGKKINRDLHKLTPGMKQIVESFGFEWRVAPGEAEAELAYLNRIGVLDGILSDDVDNFLFGATTVIRNPSNNLSGNRANPVLNSEGRDDKNHTRVYRLQDIQDHPDISFTRGDMVFIGLCSGGDYDTSGMTGCGPAIAKALVRYGFGRSLYEAGKNLPRTELPAFLHNWRNEIRHELRTDSKGYIGSKRRALASSMPDAFPDIDILLSYINPLTSESAGRASDNLKLTWSKEPDLGKLAATCEFYFEWGYRDAIIKRFKTVIWHGAVLRILRRGVLDVEDKRRRLEFVPSTPTKNGNPGAEGTPSKLITKHFSSLTLNPVAEDEDDRLITKITRTREHAFTDGILEYRLEIRPRQLVLLAESGIKNIRRPLDEDVWAGLTESGNEGGEEKAEELTAEERRAREEKEVLVWMPASMVRMAEPRLVEAFERLEEAKRLKKAGKGTKRSPAKRKPKGKAPVLSDEELSDAPRAKPSKKPVRK
ncbi:PIN domain-like protein, partial [Mycena vulgaris]